MIQHLFLVAKNKIDWFALSFVRESKDINPILRIYKKEGFSFPVIAKENLKLQIIWTNIDTFGWYFNCEVI